MSEGSQGWSWYAKSLRLRRGAEEKCLNAKSFNSWWVHMSDIEKLDAWFKKQNNTNYKFPQKSSIEKFSHVLFREYRKTGFLKGWSYWQFVFTLKCRSNKEKKFADMIQGLSYQQINDNLPSRFWFRDVKLNFFISIHGIYFRKKLFPKLQTLSANKFPTETQYSLKVETQIKFPSKLLKQTNA